MTDLVVVQRNWEKPPGGRRRRTRDKGWTLHRPDCRFVKRSNAPMPAPPVPYPNTKSCEYCRPLGEQPHTPAARRPKPSAERYNKPRGHLNEYNHRPDGTVSATCCICGIQVSAPSRQSAKRASARAHKAAESPSVPHPRKESAR